jgi:hypothetical protein
MNCGDVQRKLQAIKHHMSKDEAIGGARRIAKFLNC